MDGDLILGAKKELTLAQLKAWIKANEVGYGPMVDIGHTAEGTAATFRYQAGAITPSEVRAINEGQTITVPEKTETCRGQPFVGSHLVWVAAFR